MQRERGQLGGARGLAAGQEADPLQEGLGCGPPTSVRLPSSFLEGVAGPWGVRSCAEWLWRCLLHRRGPEDPHLPRGSGPCQDPRPEKRTRIPAARPPSPSAPLLGLPREARPPARTDTGGREGRGDSSQAADSRAPGPPGPGSGFPASEGEARAHSLETELRSAQGGAWCGGHPPAQSCRQGLLYPQEGVSPARARGPPRPTRGFRRGAGAP